MKSFPFLFAPVLLVWGCTTTAPQPRRSTFAFTHEGRRYEIVSTVSPAGDGRNLLLLREDERIVLRAADYDQNGTIDALLAGNATLEDANAAYAAGIAAARGSGHYATQPPARTHEAFWDGARYAVQTCGLASGKVHNTFVIINPAGTTEAVLLDWDADGTLDEVASGRWEVAEGQRAYERALEDGLWQDRIERVAHRYLVRTRPR